MDEFPLGQPESPIYTDMNYIRENICEHRLHQTFLKKRKISECSDILSNIFTVINAKYAAMVILQHPIVKT